MDQGGTLATWLVEVTSKGIEAVQSALGGVKPTLDAGDVAAKVWSSSLDGAGRSATAVARRLQEVADAARDATDPMTAMPAKVGNELEALARKIGLTREEFLRLSRDARGDVGDLARQLQDAARRQTAAAPMVSPSPAVQTGGAASRLRAIRDAIQDATNPMQAMPAKMGAALEAVARQLGLTQRQFNDLARSAGGDVGKIATELTKLQQDAILKTRGALEGLGTAAKYALAGATAGVLGFVRAGLQGTAEGERLSFQMQQLSRQIASVFLPTFDKVLHAVESAVGWFRQLTGEQQNGIRRWAEGAAAAGIMAAILPRIGSAVRAVAGGFRGLRAAITGTLSATGIGALLPLLGLAAEALTAVMVGTEGGRNALKEFAAVGKEMMTALKPAFEAVGNAVKDVFDAVKPILPEIAAVARELAGEFAKMVKEIAPLIAQLVKELAPLAVAVAKIGVGVLAGEMRVFLFVVKATVEPILQLVEGLNKLAKRIESMPKPPKWLMWAMMPGPMLIKQLMDMGATPDTGAGPADRGAGKNHREVTPSNGGFEQAQQSYLRVAEAASRQGFADPQKEAADSLKRIVELLEGDGLQKFLDGLANMGNRLLVQ